MDRDSSHLCTALQPLEAQFHAQCHTAGLRTFTTQTWRSYEDQDADYAQGRSIPGEIITNARGGESPHNCTIDGTATGSPASRAFDFALFDADDNELDWNASDANWKKAIAIGEALGLESGSTWQCGLIDNPHFELKNWRTC